MDEEGKEERIFHVTRLKEILVRSGLSAAAVAPKFGVSERTMQLYVKGGRYRVPYELRSQMAAFFGCSEEFLFPSYTTYPENLEENDMKRRDLLALSAGLPLALSSHTDVTLRLAHALAHPARVDETAVQSLEAVSQHAFLLDPGFSRAANYDAVLYIEKQLEGVIQLLSEAPEQFHKRIYSVGGELCMISAWLLRDLKKPEQAMVRFLQALQCATKAENYALCADIKSRIALLLIHQEGPHSALPHIQNAYQYVQRAGNSITVRRSGWISAIAAEVYGGVKDEHNTLQAIEQAGLGLEVQDDGYYVTTYTAAVYSGFKAMALLNLGRCDDARVEFEQSLSTQDMSTYRRSHKTADLGLLELQAGNIELAAGYMSEALELSTEVGSSILNNHLLKSHKKLLPFVQRCDAVRQLDKQMRECGIVAAGR